MQGTPVQNLEQINQQASSSLDQLARLLAEKQSQARQEKTRQRTLLTRHLPEWKETLWEDYRYFHSTSAKDLAFSRAGEWMLDNYYIIEQTTHQVEEDLPKGYLDELPRLVDEPLLGYPRVFGLAHELVEHFQGQVEIQPVIAFLQKYQEVTPLKMGELWALPTMFRIAVLEKLVRALAGVVQMDAPEIPGLQPVLPAPPPLTDELVVTNCFLSLKLFLSTDWKEFFEQTSRVEQVLAGDPAGVFAGMDFNSRNHYRSVVEQLSRYSSHSEETVAQKAVELARQALQEVTDHSQEQLRKTHVGYYLVDQGRKLMERQVDYLPGRQESMRQWVLEHPALTYLGSIVLVGALIMGLILLYAAGSGASTGLLILVGLLGVGIALEISVALVNWVLTHSLPPRVLPRMDYSKGIPPGHRAMVVVPCLLATPADVEAQLQDLEIRFLANPDPQLTFALLTDLDDAPAEVMPGDAEILDRLAAGIDRLNQKYPSRNPFYLFHRSRAWNPAEGVWMGWERKRGKLEEFNRLVLNQGGTSFSTILGDTTLLPEVRYVITLDADTTLPQGSANRMVATLAHILNQATFSDDGHTIAHGYSILQPRIEIKPTSANRSLFARIYSGNSGFDLYSLAISDVYQDLFGEGLYVGKGIYDVRAFEKSLAGNVPENSLLSHDMFEGLHARAALVTDIVLYEDYPSSYLTHSRRQRRWIRGDWQLFPWLLLPKGKRNSLSLIDKWKIFDNLRRSLVAPLQVAFFLLAWLVLPGSAWVWTALLLFTPGITVTAQTIHTVRASMHLFSSRDLLEAVRYPLLRWLLAIVFLPYEGLFSLRAIAVTLWRMFVSHRQMLQWTPAAHFSRSFRNDHLKTWMEMLIPLGFTLLLGAATVIIRPQVLPAAAPLLIIWLISPTVAFLISRPVSHAPAPLSAEDVEKLERLARRTWAYFEHFTTPEEHWLPPDHFQENPNGSVAHYTTPTNIGLYLLSALSAYDLGYIGLFELTVRMRNTFENMEKLERYRGHWLNWYDTRLVTPLPPRYVSTVDSGNLAGCLVALRQAFLESDSAPLFNQQFWQGLIVLLDLLEEILDGLPDKKSSAYTQPFFQELLNICSRIQAVQDQPYEWTDTLAWLSSEAWYRISRSLISLLENAPAGMDQETLGSLQLYLDSLNKQVAVMQRELKFLAPWFARVSRPPRFFARRSGTSARAAWQEFLSSLPSGLPTLGSAVETYSSIQASLDRLRQSLSRRKEDTRLVDEALDWCRRFSADLDTARGRAEGLLQGFHEMAEQVDRWNREMDFRFLFDEQRMVFHIGYNAATERLDNSYYDLLASEARLASIIAIAKGDVGPQHWQHLGRPVTRVDGRDVLLSWSGTMFEYLMPTLLTRTYAGTFVAESCEAAVLAQARFGKDRSIPWGISESGFYSFDAANNYQYRAFGLASLGFKRDLPDDVVIAPYASMIGLSLQPQQVAGNLSALEAQGMQGRYGLYEAMDYTKSRLPSGLAFGIVRSYMAHHQGMILVALDNYLRRQAMIHRFHVDEHIQAIEMLLQEKIPESPHIEYPHPDEQAGLGKAPRPVTAAPWNPPVLSPLPLVHFLGSGGYSLMVTNGGAGYSQWEDFALTRWRADTTLDDWGTWLYIQDRGSGKFWSAACQPCGGSPESQEVTFHAHKAEFHRWDNNISLHVDVAVGSEDVEVRRVELHNDSDQVRRLKLYSYAEVVLADQATDRRHPAFNKLFIESEYDENANALLFNRRPRSPDEKPVFLGHALAVEDDLPLTREYESDRSRFLGRGRSIANPEVLDGSPGRLSGTIGETLDPIMSLAQEVTLKPHSRARVTFLTTAAATRAAVLDRLVRYRSAAMVNRVFDEARSESEKELSELGVVSQHLEELQPLLSALIYPAQALRAPAAVLEKNNKGQSGLWTYGISGDLPILLVHVHESDDPLFLEVLEAFTYWRNHKAKLNLVLVNDEDTGYSLDLHNQILRQLAAINADTWLNQREGIFLLRSDQMPEADRILLETVASVSLDPRNGTLSEQVRKLLEAPVRLPAFIPSLPNHIDPEPTQPLERPQELQFDNGLGGFSQDGKEYVLFLEPGKLPPHPWINVIANPRFGFYTSEAGSGYTWMENSGENRLTPWNNDPLTDEPGEAIYLRDEETANVWSPTPLPAGGETNHIVRHGAGYTVFESRDHGLEESLRLFVPPEDPVKVISLKLKNTWQRPRRITVTYYAEWVLGVSRESTQAFIVPEYSEELNALLASNTYNTEFGSHVAFLAASQPPHGLTADRKEFLGRQGNYRSPAALDRIGLASTVRAGLDPCAVVQLHVDLQPGQEEEVFFLLGQGEDREESRAVIARYQAAGAVEQAWLAARQKWDELLDTVSVETPDKAMDLLLNRWLLYQALSCRIWGRSALYQSSGAFGFRDQLQDVMAVLHAAPQVARAQILDSASHQFEAGDVLHWWHPPSGRGVRTRISDDLLWLPYVTWEYVNVTGDRSILDEKVPFLKGEPLAENELERYSQYEHGPESFTLFEHCRRAVAKGSTSGPHGLPLMGTGDWNDGMNLVGVKGRGESIWLGWFLYATLQRFILLSGLMREDSRKYRQQAEALTKALDDCGWDGDWYLRAFYDDGARLGSRQDMECKIDSIAQSWAVLSGAANPHRAAYAMALAERQLVREQDEVVLLLTPPFDKTRRNPGYIKGYAPGVRENGGQYTHAATWVAWAFASLGEGSKAEALFRLLNPVYHADDPQKVQRYMVEPYALAADVYSEDPHTGQGGWTWYTGSAGWMYRLGVEAILGISRQGSTLTVEPCIPAEWKEYRVIYRIGQSRYSIQVQNPQGLQRGVRETRLDGEPLPDNSFYLKDDGKDHEVLVILGNKTRR